MFTHPHLVFTYRNHRGEIAQRRAVPLGIRFGKSDYYRTPQWLILAIDLERNVEREFAVANVLDQSADAFISQAVEIIRARSHDGDHNRSKSDTNGGSLRNALRQLLSSTEALLSYTNPHSVAEDHAQQWWAVRDLVTKIRFELREAVR